MTRVIYQVSEFTEQARRLVESEFDNVWLTGEISNLATPASGHIYFSLKDKNAQVRCAMFRNRRSNRNGQLKNGDAVLLSGSASIYEPRGDFQLIVEYIEPAGEGELRRRFELLKAKLAEQGLFDPKRRKALPGMPQCIGLITSPSGAALHDITVTLARRFPLADVVRYPVMVQGESACQQIADALDKANNEQRCSVLILARGGGSLEDLWAFNEEMVARAVHQSKIPVVVGVGHETDVTLADYAADHRAATPTAAAEAVTPDTAEIFRTLSALRDQMHEAMDYRFRVGAQRIDSTARRLRHPRERLQQQVERIRNCRQKLCDQQLNQLSRSHSELNHTLLRLTYCSPLQKIDLLSQGLDRCKHEIKRQLTLQLRTARWQVGQLNEKLNALSPSATLGRGFAIITTDQDGSIVRSAEQLKPGQAVTAQFARGGAVARIEKLKKAT